MYPVRTWCDFDSALANLRAGNLLIAGRHEAGAAGRVSLGLLLSEPRHDRSAVEA
ncbi:hypothetical protein XCCB100_1125 [Xanthomonas campestris pv. campestris]|uniref:Uncharacterized protein n=1 Tax=Xanthomonas campestris pv. campestris (strain B100) TaxID=509169 RepID=B0RPT8_XANCB|nr:hypothetical protein XCCB100_1125 [Xanthomonas campestris pv. campestris]